MSNSTTLIQKLDVSCPQELSCSSQTVEITETTVADVVLDFSLDNNTLIEAINFYYKIYKYNIFELLQRLLSIYIITSSSKLLEYIKDICLLSSLEEILRLETCKELCLTKPTDDCYSVLETLCLSFSKSDTITSTSKIDAITVLMRSSTYRQSAIKLFKDSLDIQSLENKYRYGLIGTLKSTFERWKGDVSCDERSEIDILLGKLQVEFYTYFLLNKSNDIMYRILSGQFLLSNNSCAKQPIYESILGICNDEYVAYNSRADATDLLLKYGDDATKEIASNIIKHLGTIGTKHAFTIYENAQNAHTEAVTQSVIDTLEKLYDRVAKHLDFETVVASILLEQSSSFDIARRQDVDTIKRVLTRIELDHAMYSKLNVTLKSVLTTVYSFIMERSEPEKDVLLHRLFTELEESDGICSTGILERIINTLSGFEDFMIKISFKEQIEGNLFGRLNARIMRLPTVPCLHHRMCNCIFKSCYASKVNMSRVKRHTRKTVVKCGVCANCLNLKCLHVCGDNCDWNTNLMDKAMEEMLVPTSIPEKRINFLIIYRLYISEIMVEMQEEFKDYISIDEFNLYFRIAMMKYDCAER